MEKTQRLAVVNNDKCRPSKCGLECMRQCPVVRMGKLCIEVSRTSTKAFISEELCTGCGICTKKCPLNAITIINIPTDLAAQTTHRYGVNGFKLHRLPIPRPGTVLGLVGPNGVGKSTAFNILAGRVVPNLGDAVTPPSWKDVLTHFRGTELQTYLSRVASSEIKAVIKPQFVDCIPRTVKGTVRQVLEEQCELRNVQKVMQELDLEQLQHRDISVLSGGELQRFAIAAVLVRQADLYMFDEPTSYLDIKQRLKAAAMIRGLLDDDCKRHIMVVEHDLAILDYLSDRTCCLYGVPGAYGVVTVPFSVREGINIFMDGFVPTENMRFRETPLHYRPGSAQEEVSSVGDEHHHEYPARVEVLHSNNDRPFTLTILKGSFSESQITVLLGENGTGKTTFMRLLAQTPSPLTFSLKPQKIAPRFQGTVRNLLLQRIRSSFVQPSFVTDVLRPLNIEALLDSSVQTLSGGELQRVAIVLCLGRPADVYLLDEPSAYLDSEQRLVCTKVIRRFIMQSRKSAFVVEHDFMVATSLADRVVLFEGEPGVTTTALAPQDLGAGMNSFLKTLNVTFRRDPVNWRPRINKFDSAKDREQKASGHYFLQGPMSRQSSV